MGRFLRENWLWILIPILVVLAGMIWILASGDGGAGDNPFDYPVF